MPPGLQFSQSDDLPGNVARLAARPSARLLEQPFTRKPSRISSFGEPDADDPKALELGCVPAAFPRPDDPDGRIVDWGMPLLMSADSQITRVSGPQTSSPHAHDVTTRPLSSRPTA